MGQDFWPTNGLTCASCPSFRYCAVDDIRDLIAFSLKNYGLEICKQVHRKQPKL